jgi:hypothetical protein
MKYVSMRSPEGGPFGETFRDRRVPRDGGGILRKQTGWGMS